MFCSSEITFYITAKTYVSFLWAAPERGEGGGDHRHKNNDWYCSFFMRTVAPPHVREKYKADLILGYDGHFEELS